MADIRRDLKEAREFVKLMFPEERLPRARGRVAVTVTRAAGASSAVLEDIKLSFRRFGNSKGTWSEPCSCFVLVLWEGIDMKSVEDVDVFKLAHQVSAQDLLDPEEFPEDRDFQCRGR